MSTMNLDSTELPVIEARTHCVLMARDPDYVYAYWDYTDQDLNRLKAQLPKGDAQLILRIYDISGINFNGTNAKYSWDVVVDDLAKKRYVQVWQDNAEYCLELGLASGKTFVPLTRSNMVRTAPKSFSKRDDLIWRDIEQNNESRVYIKQDPKNLNSRKRSKVYYLSTQDIRTFYRKFFTQVSDKGMRRVFSIEDLVKGMPDDMSWEKVEAISNGRPWSIRRSHPGASEGMFSKDQQGSEGQQWQPGSSENIFSSQPGASEGRLAKRQFFFEIATELIVYGRTEPDASVWLNGQDVKLKADGTFSLRYTLPDGEIPLKFIAQSADGVEQRHIDTGVEREQTIAFPKLLKEFHG